MHHFRPVLALADIPPGSFRKVTTNYQDVLVFNLTDGVFAMSALCPHARGPLEKGIFKDGLLTCPWHNWQFDPHTGASPGGSTAKCYPVKVEDGQVFVDAGPTPAVPPRPKIELPEDM